MIGYKLFRVRKDGSLGPLFINRGQRLTLGTKYVAEAHKTPGYAFRLGWHICEHPVAPHLSKKGRVWAVVEFGDWEGHERPKSQGGLWFTAGWMRIVAL